jgi:hypothetical protein
LGAYARSDRAGYIVFSYFTQSVALSDRSSSEVSVWFENHKLLREVAMLYIIGSIIVACLLFVAWCMVYSSEQFPDYYNPVCFECNKGGETCKSCKFLDPDYRGSKEEILEATNYRLKL